MKTKTVRKVIDTKIKEWIDSVDDIMVNL